MSEQEFSMDDLVISGEGTVTPVDVEDLGRRMAKAAMAKEPFTLTPGELRVITDMIMNGVTT